MNTLREKIVHTLYNRLDWVMEITCMVNDSRLLKICLEEQRAILTVKGELED